MVELEHRGTMGKVLRRPPCHCPGARHIPSQMLGGGLAGLERTKAMGLCRMKPQRCKRKWRRETEIQREETNSTETSLVQAFWI